MGPQDRESRDKNCAVDVPTQIMMQRARFSRMDHLLSCNGRLLCKDRTHVVDSDVKTSESVFGRLIPNSHTFYAHLITRPISRLSLAFNNSTLIFPKEYVPHFYFNRPLTRSAILYSPQSNTDSHVSLSTFLWNRPVQHSEVSCQSKCPHILVAKIFSNSLNTHPQSLRKSPGYDRMIERVGNSDLNKRGNVLMRRAHLPTAAVEKQ
jgi:hypothetical protein